MKSDPEAEVYKRVATDLKERKQVLVAATGDVGEICKRIEDPDRMFRMAATDLFVEKAQYILTPGKKDVARRHRYVLRSHVPCPGPCGINHLGDRKR